MIEQQRAKTPKSAVCRLGGVSRRVRVGDRFEVPHLAGTLLIEVTGIESVDHCSEPEGYYWQSWRPVLKVATAATS